MGVLKLNDVISVVPHLKVKTETGYKYILLRDDLVTHGITYPFIMDELIRRKTDLIFVTVFEGEKIGYREVINEDLKSKIRNKYFLKTSSVLTEVDPKEIQNLPILDVKRQILLLDFLKRTKKVTRYCCEISCDKLISVYKSDLKRNRGLFCCTAHSNKNKNEQRITNVCKICGIEYDSLYQEDYCSIECEEFDKL